uniref:Uncharacterized protein n=1 Tax=Mus spicilegus TaxID=10103 RepID=A0A8C6I0M3_MUSSI
MAQCRKPRGESPGSEVAGLSVMVRSLHPLPHTHSIAVAILFHACQLSHIVAVTCLPITDTESYLAQRRAC